MKPKEPLKQWLGDQIDPEKKRLREENARLSKVLGLVEGFVKGVEPVEWLVPPKRERRLQATACIQFSDWHFDETVNPSEIMGINAYDREIATLRLKRWADLSCEMGDLERHDYDGALVIANGDFVSGAIHDELKETNADHLPGTMTYWAPLIAASLKQVADRYGQAVVVVVVGNHGRLTKKKEAKGRVRNSWDWLLFQMVAMILAGDKRIQFQFAAGHHHFVKVYGRDIGVTHGDSMGGGGGISGITTPLTKTHAKVQRLGLHLGLKVEYTVIGHWHTTVQAHEFGVVCNGSGKGYDDYAASLLLAPEEAKQNFWVETPKRGVTAKRPMFLLNRKKEGW